MGGGGRPPSRSSSAFGSLCTDNSSPAKRRAGGGNPPLPSDWHRHISKERQGKRMCLGRQAGASLHTQNAPLPSALPEPPSATITAPEQESRLGRKGGTASTPPLHCWPASRYRACLRMLENVLTLPCAQEPSRVQRTASHGPRWRFCRHLLACKPQALPCPPRSSFPPPCCGAAHQPAKETTC